MFTYKKIRPVKEGYSIGVDNLESGTMGCLVGDSNNDYILTCNHVISGNLYENIDKYVLQPSPKYGGKIHRDAIAKVYEFDEIFYNQDNNFTDSAIAITDREKASIDIALIGPILGINNASIGQSVKKVGSTTELTNGVIRDRNVTMVINFLGRDVIFKNQITTSKMSELGDSGAVLLNKKKRH